MATQIDDRTRELAASWLDTFDAEDEIEARIAAEQDRLDEVHQARKEIHAKLLERMEVYEGEHGDGTVLINRKGAPIVLMTDSIEDLGRRQEPGGPYYERLVVYKPVVATGGVGG